MDARAEIRALRRRAAAARRRAAQAASLAVRHETQAALAPESLLALHTRMRDLYRQIEARHLAAVRVTELHATRMERWLNGASGQASRPVFMAAVASALGTPSAAVTLRGQRHTSFVGAVSDATAQAAHELEFVMSEGRPPKPRRRVPPSRSRAPRSLIAGRSTVRPSPNSACTR